MADDIYPFKLHGLLLYRTLKTSQFSTLVQRAPNNYATRIPQAANPLWHFQLVYDYLYTDYLSPNNTRPYAPYTDLDTLMGFVAAHRGMANDFLFTDPSDFTPAGLLSSAWQPNTAYAAGAVILDTQLNAQQVTGPGTSGASTPPWNPLAGGFTGEGSVTWLNLGSFPDGYPAPVTLQVLTDGLGNYYSPIQRNIGGQFLEDITDLVAGTLQVFNAGAPASPFNFSIAGPGLALPGASFMGLYIKWNAQPVQPVTASFQFYFRVGFEDDTQDFERWMKGLWTIGGSGSQSGSGYVKLCSSRPRSV